MSFMSRRTFLASSAALAGAAVIPAKAFADDEKVARESGVRLKLGLNAFSFDEPLRKGTMTLTDAVHFCARNGIDALDTTAYYFPGYPKPPADDFVYGLKRAAFVNGVAISGTGVRNDFAVPDVETRQADVQMVKNWIEVAGKLGAPVIRVFSGKERPDGYTFNQVLKWMVADFKAVAASGRQHGVVVALQPHNDFLKTAAETIRVIEAVNSPWFACILDIGSLRSGDPYAEIQRLVPYAVSWQIKENVWRNGKEEPTDLAKIKAIIDRSGYRGYLPFEALDSRDPMQDVTNFLQKIRQAFAPDCPIPKAS